MKKQFILPLFAASSLLLWQNCGKSFSQIDPMAKNRLISNTRIINDGGGRAAATTPIPSGYTELTTVSPRPAETEVTPGTLRPVTPAPAPRPVPAPVVTQTPAPAPVDNSALQQYVSSQLLSNAFFGSIAGQSPLVLDLGPTGEALKLELTSIFDGVFFDIQGRRAQPVAHTPQRISWIQDSRIMFLVLPNQRGRVDGIDELFGNNTFGPDHRFAENGYEALRKFDGTSFRGRRSPSQPDGVIDSRDAVFNELRLWSDQNRDGIAQPEELHQLSELAVSSIDLNFDPNYQEQDQYGNWIRMKSVFRKSNGELRLMYDIWFAESR